MIAEFWQWLTGQDTPEVVVNANFFSLQHQGVYAMDPSTTELLTWGYLGGRWGGFSVTAGTLTLTASVLNYVVVDRSTGVISVSTSSTNWNDTDDYGRVYLIDAGATTVDLADVEDHRAGPGGVHGSIGSGGGGGGGDVNGPGSSTDNAIPRWDGSGGDTLQDSGVLITDNNEISGYRAHINAQTGTTYTLDASDNGKIVQLTNGAAIALTVPNSFPVGFNCTIVQGGAGQVTIASTGSGTVVNRQSHTKTAGTNAFCAVYVRSNSGTNAVWVLGGDTAA